MTGLGPQGQLAAISHHSKDIEVFLTDKEHFIASRRWDGGKWVNKDKFKAFDSSRFTSIAAFTRNKDHAEFVYASQGGGIKSSYTIDGGKT